MTALLVAKSDGTLLLRIDLARRRVVTIGRSPRCDVTLTAPSVSRRHAILFGHAGGWRVTDTGSRHGLHTEAGKTLATDLTERTWCRIGPAHLWFDPLGANPPSMTIPDPDAMQLLDDPDRESGPVLTLFDPRDRPLRRVALRDHDGLLVGTSPGCDLVVNDPRVGPIQAVFYRERSRWCVADAGGGEFPLLAEGRRTRRLRLHGGMVFTLGDHRLVASGSLRRATEARNGEMAGETTGEMAGEAMVGGRADVEYGIDPSEGTDAPESGPLSAFLNEQ